MFQLLNSALLNNNCIKTENRPLQAFLKKIFAVAILFNIGIGGRTYYLQRGLRKDTLS